MHLASPFWGSFRFFLTSEAKKKEGLSKLHSLIYEALLLLPSGFSVQMTTEDLYRIWKDILTIFSQKFYRPIMKPTYLWNPLEWEFLLGDQTSSSNLKEFSEKNLKYFPVQIP